MTIALYTPTLSPRIQYAAALLFQDLLGFTVVHYTALNEWADSTFPRLCYTAEALPAHLPKHLHLPASGLLLERDIRRKAIVWHHHKGVPVCFAMDGSKALPYDALAMVFYFATRYEEYLDAPRDAHDRFVAQSSALYPYLHRPVLHDVAQQVGEALRAYFPQAVGQRPAYRYQPTYDIDYAWAYLHKGVRRALGGLAREVLTRQWSPLKQRLSTWLGLTPDPYHTFSLLSEWQAQYELSPIYFWLVGAYGTHDKNIGLDRPAFQALIRGLSANAATGWHPSYAAYDAPMPQLLAEKSALETVIERSVHQSRQHYLRLRMPDTYHRLLAAGITDEYSMGYAEAIGFRAGLAIPYWWYDLSREAVTPLRVHPFAVMDVTLKNYLRLSPQEACVRITELVEVLRQTGGTFTSLWHNNSLSDRDDWAGWRRVYIHLLAVAHKPA